MMPKPAEDRGFMLRIITVSLIAILIIGCSGVETAAKRGLSFHNYTQANYPAKSKDSAVKLFFNSIPEKEYEVIGEVQGSFSGDIKEILEAKTRQVGGDGMIDIEVSSRLENAPDNLSVKMSDRPFGTTPVYNPGYSYKVYTVKAKVVRYKE